MKTTNAATDRDDNHQLLTPTEMEACRQFEACDRPGQVLFRPRVSSGEPTPDCLVFLEGICRFGLIFLHGQYSVRDGQWYRCENADDVPMATDNPLEEAWQRAMAAKTELRQELDIGAFFIPVVVFADMEPDDDILDELRGRKVRVLWGMEDLVERMLGLPDRDDTHTRLNNRFIEKEIAVLTQRAPRAADAPEQMTLDLPDAGRSLVDRAETVNVYITIAVSAGAGGDPPLLSVQGQ